jgi:hypothetical protein
VHLPFQTHAGKNWQALNFLVFYSLGVQTANEFYEADKRFYSINVYNFLKNKKSRRFLESPAFILLIFFFIHYS